MNLELRRVAIKPTYTIGKLYINGVYFCDTLEDTNRDHNKDGDLNDKNEGKIYGQTAIPYGSYKVIINKSKRFKRFMPLLLDVPHFAGIRIHEGNIPEHTHGCILVGKNTIKGRLTDSKKYYDELYQILSREKNILITIS